MSSRTLNKHKVQRQSENYSEKHYRENLDGLIAQNYSKSNLDYFTTGGTTGTPLGFYSEKGFTIPKELAFVWRHWNWAGFYFG